MKLTNTEVCKCPQLDLSSNHPLQVIAVVRILLSAPTGGSHSSISLINPTVSYHKGRNALWKK